MSRKARETWCRQVFASWALLPLLDATPRSYPKAGRPQGGIAAKSRCCLLFRPRAGIFRVSGNTGGSAPAGGREFRAGRFPTAGIPGYRENARSAPIH